MIDLEFPALFVSADAASNSKQVTYLHLVRLEYGLLFVAAVMTVFDLKDIPFLTVYALVFVGSFLTLAWRAHSKPEQAWYKSRALAESVKTLCWRYSMRAEPFGDAQVSAANKDFRDSLAALLRSNRQLGEHLAGLDVTGSQITTSMSEMRAKPLIDRNEYYLEHRVRNQKQWYSKKAKVNKSGAKIWQIVAGAAYLCGFIMVVLRIPFAEATFPIEPVIVFASAILGWMQIKKFNELASAYALTAHEIGIAETLILDADSEAAFSKAVNEVELVFSREHTQWVARQTAGE